MAIVLKSAYEAYAPEDGERYLVETYWPEGVGTFDLHPYIWLRELAPSYELRSKAELEKWDYERFRAEYRKQLEETADPNLCDILVREAQTSTVTFLCDTHKKYEAIGPEDTTACDLRDFLLHHYAAMDQAA